MLKRLPKFSRLITWCLSTLLVLGGAALLVFGDKPKAYQLPNGEPIGQRTVVNFWENWTGVEGQAMRDVVDKFNMSQNQIYINAVEVSTIDIKTLISVAGGDPPDIVVLWSGDMDQFIAYNALTPLDSLEDKGVITPHTYVPYIWRLCAPFGRLYAVAATPEINMLYWNKVLFAAAGLDPDKPPQTIDELNAMSHRLTLYDSLGHLKQIGFIPMVPGWFNCMWGIYFGNDLYNYQTGYFNIDTSQQIAAYNWFSGFSKQLGFGAVDSFLSGSEQQFDSPLNPFMSGKVAMELIGPYFSNFIRRNNPELVGHYGVAPFPTSFGEPGDAYQGDCDLWVIPRGAGHLQAAMQVLAFFSEPDNIEYLCDKHCKPSPLMIVSKSFIANNPNPYIQEFEQAMHAQNVQVFPPSPIWARVKSELDDAAQRIWYGAPVEETLKQEQTLIDQWTQEALQLQKLRAEQVVRR
ncbi:MAG TPA: extracellular solute-binding protein [Phycisphaerae bacterium]|nr:extracellular solute-binding protein [Phycisphaerae bacterium]